MKHSAIYWRHRAKDMRANAAQMIAHAGCEDLPSGLRYQCAVQADEMRTIADRFDEFAERAAKVV